MLNLFDTIKYDFQTLYYIMNIHFFFLLASLFTYSECVNIISFENAFVFLLIALFCLDLPVPRFQCPQIQDIVH